MDLADFIKRKSQVDQVNKKLLERFDVITYVPLMHIFCNEESCKSMSEGGTLYRDSDHVSRLGAELVVDEIDKIINE